MASARSGRDSAEHFGRNTPLALQRPRTESHQHVPHLEQLQELVALCRAQLHRVEQRPVGPAELRDHSGIAPVVLAGTFEDQAELAGVSDHGMASAFPGQGRDPADVGAGFHADGGAGVAGEKLPQAFRGVDDLLAEELFPVRGETDGLVILVAEVEADCGSSVHGCSPVFGCWPAHHGPA